jgi:PAS domain S-box-containing protein
MGAAIWSFPGATRHAPPRVLRYGLAIASVGLALLATRALGSELFVPAILLTAWFGGTGPGVLAIGLSLAAKYWRLTASRDVSQGVSLDDALYLMLWGASVLLVVWLTRAQRRTEAVLHDAQDDLKARMRDLEVSNDRLQAEILERTRAEAEVYKQASLLDLTHDSVFVRGLDDLVTYWNRGAEERYGWPAAEAVGLVSHELLQTAFPEPLEQITATLLRTGRWDGELVHTKRDGTRILVTSRWALQCDAQGQPAGVLETNSDITERRRAEYLVGQVFDTSPDAVSIVGRDYRHQRVNPVYERRSGIVAERIVGMHLMDVTGADVFAQKVRPKLDRCFAGEEVSDSDWFAGPAGRRYLSVCYSPLRPTGSERVEAALLISRDLTEHVRAAEALQRAQAELAHVTRLTTLGEITASIAHEVNQPLAAISMNGNACRRWLAANPPDLDEAREAAQLVVSDAERAGQIIARIRNLVRHGTPERSALDVNAVVREALAFTRGELERHGIAIHSALDDGLPAVLGDRVQLQQVMVNLLLNACDAMADVTDAPRDLTVGSRRAADDTRDAGGVLVEVRDTGRGIDRAQAERMFEAFFSTKPHGLGMGLSISRSIVERHGGRIWAAAHDGPGVTMQFTLPATLGGA